jgi:hypothetical protein
MHDKFPFGPFRIFGSADAKLMKVMISEVEFGELNRTSPRPERDPSSVSIPTAIGIATQNVAEPSLSPGGDIHPLRCKVSSY